MTNTNTNTNKAKTSNNARAELSSVMQAIKPSVSASGVPAYVAERYTLPVHEYDAKHFATNFTDKVLNSEGVIIHKVIVKGRAKSGTEYYSADIVDGAIALSKVSAKDFRDAKDLQAIHLHAEVSAFMELLKAGKLPSKGKLASMAKRAKIYGVITDDEGTVREYDLEQSTKLLSDILVATVKIATLQGAVLADIATGNKPKARAKA